MQRIKDALRLHLLGGISSCRQLAPRRRAREISGGGLLTTSEGRGSKRLAGRP